MNSYIVLCCDLKLQILLCLQNKLLFQLYCLSKERTDLSKKLLDREEEIKRIEARLTQTHRDKTTLVSRVASLEKQLFDLQKSNDLLKNKVKKYNGTDWHRLFKVNC